MTANGQLNERRIGQYGYDMSYLLTLIIPKPKRTTSRVIKNQNLKSLGRGVVSGLGLCD